MHKNLWSMSASMIEVGEELKVALDKVTDNKRGKLTDEAD